MVTKLDNEIWESLWGSDGAGIAYWCDRVRSTSLGFNGIYESANLWVEDSEGNIIPNPHNLALHDSYEDVWYEVSLGDISNAYRKVLDKGLTHCGGYPIHTNNSDSCFEDVVLQYAVFGEMVYG